MNFNSIGYFQFENLIQGRVPMTLFLLEGVEIKNWYNSFINMHLQNISVSCKPEEVLSIVKERKLPAQHAIVILDKEGKISPQLITQLEDSQFTNAFYVENGLRGLEAERHQ